jgi:hypothetical protein
MNIEKERSDFEAALPEMLDRVPEFTFNRTHDGEYYNHVTSKTFEGRKPADYSSVQMLWECWQLARNQSQPAPQWIAVTERLPNDHLNMAVDITVHAEEMGLLIVDEAVWDGHKWHDGSGREKWTERATILAWQPKVKPYRPPAPDQQRGEQ